MAKRPLGIAVVGCGSTAHRRHLPVWRGMDDARLVAVVSRDAARREAARQEFGAEMALEDWRQLAAIPEVEAVDICPPHPTHAEITCALATAGKHVLCEKPMATTLEDARRMAEAARRAGVVLMPFHNMRLLGASRAAVACLREGVVGQPHLVRGVMAHGGPDARDPRRKWFLEAAAGGGVVLDLGPHLFDLTRVLLGQPAVRVRASTLTPAGWTVERDALVEIVFADESRAQLALSWSLVGGRETQITVQGSAGHLRLTLVQDPPGNPGHPPVPLTLVQVGEGTEIRHPTPAATEDPCALFVRAVRDGVRSLEAEDGVASLALVDGVYRSADGGGVWVDL